VFAAFSLFTLGDRPHGIDAASARIARVDLVVAALFGAFWLWAPRAPVAALASALAVHLGVWIVGGIVDRSTLLDGYVIRVAALVIFAAGLRAALAARRT
jgi:hypothetical protein